jgi:hypothetical protein
MSNQTENYPQNLQNLLQFPFPLNPAANCRVSLDKNGKKYLVDGFCSHEEEAEIIAVYHKDGDKWDELDDIEFSEADWDTIFEKIYTSLQLEYDKDFDTELEEQLEAESQLFMSEMDEY